MGGGILFETIIRETRNAGIDTLSGLSAVQDFSLQKSRFSV